MAGEGRSQHRLGGGGLVGSFCSGCLPQACRFWERRGRPRKPGALPVCFVSARHWGGEGEGLIQGKDRASFAVPCPTVAAGNSSAHLSHSRVEPPRPPCSRGGGGKGEAPRDLPQWAALAMQSGKWSPCGYRQGMGANSRRVPGNAPPFLAAPLRPHPAGSHTQWDGGRLRPLPASVASSSSASRISPPLTSKAAPKGASLDLSRLRLPLRPAREGANRRRAEEGRSQWGRRSR